MAVDNCEESAGVARTERGLVIAGTRVTLYLLVDYVLAQWPAHLIAEELGIPTAKIEAALAYLQEHKAAVLAEYVQVLQQNEELRRYYAERQQALRARIQSLPETPQRRRFHELQQQNRLQYGL